MPKHKKQWIFRWLNEDGSVKAERICDDDPRKFKMMKKALDEGRASAEQADVPDEEDVPFVVGKEVKVRVGRELMTPEKRKADLAAEALGMKEAAETERQRKTKMIDDTLAKVALAKPTERLR